MPFDLDALLTAHRGEAYELHGRYLNPQLAKVLTTIGFDRTYVRGEGAYLIDDQGDRTLDFLSGFGVFALGRSHPVVKDALHQALDADLPNLAQLDCAVLPGLLAGRWSTGPTPASDGLSSPTRGPRRSRPPSSSPAAPPGAPGSSTATTPSTG